MNTSLKLSKIELETWNRISKQTLESRQQIGAMSNIYGISTTSHGILDKLNWIELWTWIEWTVRVWKRWRSSSYAWWWRKRYYCLAIKSKRNPICITPHRVPPASFSLYNWSNIIATIHLINESCNIELCVGCKWTELVAKPTRLGKNSTRLINELEFE